MSTHQFHTPVSSTDQFHTRANPLQPQKYVISTWIRHFLTSVQNISVSFTFHFNKSAWRLCMELTNYEKLLNLCGSGGFELNPGICVELSKEWPLCRIDMLNLAMCGTEGYPKTFKLTLSFCGNKTPISCSDV